MRGCIIGVLIDLSMVVLELILFFIGFLLMWKFCMLIISFGVVLFRSVCRVFKDLLLVVMMLMGII